MNYVKKSKLIEIAEIARRLLAFSNHVFFKKQGLRLLFQILEKAAKIDEMVEIYKSCIPIIALYDPELIPISDNINDYLGEDESSEVVELLRKATQYSPYVDLESLFQNYSTKWNKAIFERAFIVPNHCPYNVTDCVEFLNDNLEYLTNLARDSSESDKYFFMWDLFEKEYLCCLLPRIRPTIMSEPTCITLKVCPPQMLIALLNFMDNGMIPNGVNSESRRCSVSRLKLWRNERTREAFIEIIRQCMLLPLTEYDTIVKAVNLVDRIYFSVTDLFYLLGE